MGRTLPVRHEQCLVNSLRTVRNDAINVPYVFEPRRSLADAQAADSVVSQRFSSPTVRKGAQLCRSLDAPGNSTRLSSRCLVVSLKGQQLGGSLALPVLRSCLPARTPVCRKWAWGEGAYEVMESCRERRRQTQLSLPKRQRTAALQDAARGSWHLGGSPVLECASPLALSHRARRGPAAESPSCELPRLEPEPWSFRRLCAMKRESRFGQHGQQVGRAVLSLPQGADALGKRRGEDTAPYLSQPGYQGREPLVS